MALFKWQCENNDFEMYWREEGRQAGWLAEGPTHENALQAQRVRDLRVQDGVAAQHEQRRASGRQQESDKEANLNCFIDGAL